MTSGSTGAEAFCRQLTQTLIAGSGSNGTILGDGGPATQAFLGDPISVTVTPAGDLIVTDLLNNRLRAVTP